MTLKKNFYSDNVSGAAPEILQALVEANAGDTAPYGADPTSERLQSRFSEVFETEVEVYPVGTGTAANGLCASVVAAPYGAIYLSDIAHLQSSECGGPEFWSGGNARGVAVPSAHGKIAVTELARMIDEALARPATEVPPRAVSLTQGTEASTVYTLSEVRAIAEAARARRLWVHMDGSRLANTVARLGCTPAEATWKAGVDVLSFGATKNGALAAEAIVFFNRELAQTMRYRRRRGGHLFSKMRFFSVQLDAYITNGLWIRNARHANAMAQRIRDGLAKIPGVRFPSPTEINLVLASLPQPVWDGLVADGYSFSRRGAPSEGIVRIACAFDTTAEAADALVAAAHRHAGLGVGADQLGPGDEVIEMDFVDLDAAREFSPTHHVHKSLTSTPRSDISIACWEPGQTSPIHCHPGADEIYHVIEGEGMFNDGRTERRLGRGGTVIFPAGEAHQVTAVTRMVLYRVQAGADRRAESFSAWPQASSR